MLRLGQISVSSSTRDYFQTYTNGNNVYNKNNKNIALVHAYSDQAYDRSSFHLAGNADLVADVASYVALDAINSLKSFNRNGDSNDVDATSTTSTAHPLIGLVDHISVMPLSTNIGDFHQITDINRDNNDDQVHCDNNYVPPDYHGLCSVYIGNQLTQHHDDIDVLYYGSAHPNQIPLATVRREKTKFFYSGGLEKQQPSSTSAPNINQCTVGSPPTFVENYNILLSQNITKKKAMTLTKRIRARDGGIRGVEALTLPYSRDRFEVACNLLCPEEEEGGNVDDIIKVVDKWVLEQQKEMKEKYSSEDFSRDFFVDDNYRVGTTSEQCMDVLNSCCNGTTDSHGMSTTTTSDSSSNQSNDFMDEYDKALVTRFHQYLSSKV